MGEIKSTLDLVMEKTKNLNLSDAEKQDQENKEIENRLNGLLQKFQDQIVTLEQFECKYQALLKAHNLTEGQHQHLHKAICARIELGEDNEALLDLLSRFSGPNAEGLTVVLQEFETAIQTAARGQRQLAKERLAGDHSITGSAVVPNLDKDAAWIKMAAEIRAKFEELLNKARTKLPAG